MPSPSISRRDPASPGRPPDAAAAKERREWDPEGDGAVHSQAPAEGDHAVTDEGDGHDHPDDRSDCEPECRPLVVVERRQGACDETAEDLRDRRDDDPGQEDGGLVARAGLGREHVRDAVRPDDRDADQRDERQCEPGRPGGELPAEPSGRPGLGKARQHDHTQRPGNEDERAR